MNEVRACQSQIPRNRPSSCQPPRGHLPSAPLAGHAKRLKTLPLSLWEETAVCATSRVMTGIPTDSDIKEGAERSGVSRGKEVGWGDVPILCARGAPAVWQVQWMRGTGAGGDGQSKKTSTPRWRCLYFRAGRTERSQEWNSSMVKLGFVFCFQPQRGNKARICPLTAND